MNARERPISAHGTSRSGCRRTGPGRGGQRRRWRSRAQSRRPCVIPRRRPPRRRRAVAGQDGRWRRRQAGTSPLTAQRTGPVEAWHGGRCSCVRPCPCLAQPSLDAPSPLAATPLQLPRLLPPLRRLLPALSSPPLPRSPRRLRPVPVMSLEAKLVVLGTQGALRRPTPVAGPLICRPRPVRPRMRCTVFSLWTDRCCGC